MCHILLILPLLALPVFWIWPLPLALSVYGAVVGLSAVIYWYAILAMRQPRQNGPEGMIGTVGRVVIGELGEVRSELHGELWPVVTTGPLRHGDRVKVVAAESSTLRVQKLDAGAMSTGS
jgi:membrane protein implicated in regulation of membrane protease activity